MPIEKTEPLDIWLADRKKLLDDFRTTADCIPYAGNIDQRRMLDRQEFDELYDNWIEYMQGR